MALSSTLAHVDPHAVLQMLADGHELALLDVREHGQFGEGHLFDAVSVPYSRLDDWAVQRVPRLSTRIVLCDSGQDDVALRAARRLLQLGYRDLHVLDGGVRAWRDAGLQLFKGVNVRCKTFGEIVELQRHTPVITAHDLFARQARGEAIVIIDGRPLDEHRRMRVPGALHCPNGELAARIDALVPDPQTTIVIHCAGRTRGIIGCQTLIDLGVPNPVYALENGTQGWALAGYVLDRGPVSARFDGGAVNPESAGIARQRAQRFAMRCKVPIIDSAMAQAFADDPARTTFLLDVRTPEAWRKRTLPGARCAPGGQLIQALDQSVGVLHARLLVFDDDGIRALVVAGWLKQQGHDVHVLGEGLAARVCLREPVVPSRWPMRRIAPADIAACRTSKPPAWIDLRSSEAWRTRHLAGSIWSIRPRVPALLRQVRTPDHEHNTVVLIAEDEQIAGAVAHDLDESGFTDIRFLDASMDDCEAAGLQCASSQTEPSPQERIDFLYFVHDRHDGNLEASREYLAWETNLPAQITPQERGAFRVID